MIFDVLELNAFIIFSTHIELRFDKSKFFGASHSILKIFIQSELLDHSSKIRTFLFCTNILFLFGDTLSKNVRMTCENVVRKNIRNNFRDFLKNVRTHVWWNDPLALQKIHREDRQKHQTRISYLRVGSAKRNLRWTLTHRSIHKPTSTCRKWDDMRTIMTWEWSKFTDNQLAAKGKKNLL